MPAKRPRIPKLSHHKASGQALVRIGGRYVYLGKFGTAEAEEREREAARQRELAQAKKLAEVESRRAEEQQKRLDEQARAATRLKRLVAVASLTSPSQ